MDYGKIISRSWQLIKNRRYLWLLGFFALLTEGGSGFTNYYRTSLPGVPSSQPSSTNTAWIKALFTKVFAASDSGVGSFTNGDYLALFVVIIILLIIATVIYLSFSSRAGLIKAIDTIETDESKKLSFGWGVAKGRKSFWKLLLLQILIAVLIIGIIAVAGMPLLIYFLYYKISGWLIFSIIWAVLGVLAFILAAVYLSIITRLAEREIVLNKVGVFRSLSLSYKLLKKQPGKTIIVWLISIGLGMGYGIAVGLALAILLLVLGGIGYGLYLLSTVAMIIYAVVFGLALLVVLFTIAGTFNSFLSAYWTLSYRALNYLAKN